MSVTEYGDTIYSPIGISFEVVLPTGLIRRFEPVSSNEMENLSIAPFVKFVEYNSGKSRI